MALAVLTTGGAWTLGAQSASAAGTDRYVSVKTGDDTNNTCDVESAPCKTIQHAVDSATADNTIHIAAGTYPESVLDDDNATNATFVGAGMGQTKVTGYSAGAGTVGFGFDVEGSPATLRDLTVGGVQAGVGAGSEAPGFGVEVEGTQVTFTDVDVSGNADVGVFAQGGEVTATGSHFDHNGNSVAIGELNGEIFPPCGIVGFGSTISVDTSSASSNGYCGVGDSNLALVGGQLTANVPGATLTVTRSTAAHNHGPGLIDEADTSGRVSDSTIDDNAGYGIGVAFADTTITHTTIAGTTSNADIPNSDQAGIAVEDVNPAAPQLSSAKVTRALRALSRHQSGKARRLSATRLRAAAPAFPTTSTVTVTGSIVGANEMPDCAQHVTDGSYNLSSDAANSCGFSASEHSLTRTNPELGALGSHGGLTQTRLPLKASPAIDAEPTGTAGCDDGAVDQRGVPRPQPSGGRCDLGSVELVGAKLAISTASLPHGTVGKDYSATVHATGGQYPTYTWSLTEGSLPPGIRFADGTFSGAPTKAGTYTVTVSVNDPVSRTYPIVIDAAATGADHANGTGSKLADTGVPTVAMAAFGAVLVLLGWATLYVAGLVGRRSGRHRRMLG